MSRSYSNSMLQAAYRCQKYYKYLYVDKLIPEGKHSSDLAFGSAMHFAIEQSLVHKADIIESFKLYWEPIADGLEYGRLGREALEVNAEILLPRFERLHAKKIKVEQIEKRLYGKIQRGQDGNTCSVEGTPDVLGDYENLPSIIDFKTSSFRYPKEKIYLAEQMYLYAHLAAQNGFTAAQVVFIVFIKGTTPSIQTLTRRIDIQELNNVVDNIALQCQALDIAELNNAWSKNTNSCIQGERVCTFFSKCWKGYKT